MDVVRENNCLKLSRIYTDYKAIRIFPYNDDREVAAYSFKKKKRWTFFN